MAKNKKGGLVVVIIVLVVALGGVGALVAMGKIPLLAKKPNVPPSTYGEGKEPPKGEPAKPAEDTKKADGKAVAKGDAKSDAGKKPNAGAAEATPDPVKGAKKLASVWNNMEISKLSAIAKEYPEAELPIVVSRMDPEKAAELLAVLDPKISAKLSEELARLGALPTKGE